MERLLRGDYSSLPPIQSNTVRIFISSTFGDFIQERNELMKRVYPELRKYCHLNGLEFEVVDMRWGVRDEAIANQLTSDICIEEIINCQKMSLGPTFVAFLGNRYGFRPFPSQISIEHFGILMETASTNKINVCLLNTWYKQDDNASPPVYQLQPITLQFKNYNSKNSSLRQTDRDAWWQTFSKIQQLFWQLAEQSVRDNKMSADLAHKFQMSVTEDEIVHGVFKVADPSSHCLCYMRELEGIHNSLSDDMAWRYTDTVSDPPALDTNAQKLLLSLKEEKIPTHLSPGNIRHFTTPWKAGGIDPSDSGHTSYLSKFCDYVYSDLKALIERARSAQDHLTDKLYSEVHHHASFCMSKCESFHGREDILTHICSHLKARNGRPLVLYGSSGSGKTSIMAKIATSIQDWLGPTTCIVRFLGTSPSSSNLRELLVSICLQLYSLCSLTPPKFGQMDTTQVIQFFRCQLLESLPLCQDGSLLLLMDSIDQLSPADGAHTLKWLPKSFPANVSIIISMLPQRYGCLDTIRTIIPSEECYVKVDAMPVDIGIDMLNAWLAKIGRLVTPAQQKVVSKAFALCPQPLFMKLLFHEALHWRSYTKPETIVLPTSTSSALQHLFEWLEEKHGQTLVGHSLGYLSASKSGLTEAELEDILSLDDQVLDDVYQYWDPPIAGIVRIPLLLWKRIKHDIGEYLVHQQADGMTVLKWYHRQFMETASNRYLSCTPQKSYYHSVLVTFFEGTYSGEVVKPIFLSHRQINLQDASRQVPPQPLRFSETVYNLRKLNELPFHLSHAGMFDRLKTISLCNLQWVLHKLSATSYASLVRDYTVALSLQHDRDLHIVSESLSLSAHNLQNDPTSLAGQLLGRLALVRDKTSSPVITELLGEAESHALSSSRCQLIPQNSCLINPGGCLKTTLLGHTQVIQRLCISRANPLLVSASKGQGSIAVFNIWDLSNLECIQNMHTMSIPGTGAPQLAVSSNVAVGSCDHTVTLWNALTGEELHQLHFPSKVTALAISLKGNIVLTGSEDGSVFMWSSETQSYGSSTQFAEHKSAVTAIAIATSSNDQFSISASKDGSVCVCNVHSLQESHFLAQSHTGAVTCICTTSHSGSLMAFTGSDDKNILAINLEDRKVSNVMKGHTKAIKCLCCHQIQQTSRLITGSLDKTIKIWDTGSGECLHTLSGHADAVWCLEPVGNSKLVSGSKDDYLKVWDLANTICLHTLEGHSSWVSCVTTIGESTVVSGSNDKSIKVWRLKQEEFPLLERHLNQPECIFAPTSDTIVSGSPTEVKLWSASDGTCLNTWPISASALTSNGQQLLSGGKNGKIICWDIKTLQELACLEGHSGAITCLAILRDSSQLFTLSASTDCTIRKWNVNTGSCIATLSGHKDAVKCLAISNDQSLIASGSLDSSVKLWTSITHKCTATLIGHSKTVGCIAFSSDGNMLVSGSDDCTLRVWDIKHNINRHTIYYPDSVKCLALAPMRSSIVIAGAHCGKHQLRSWNLLSGEFQKEYEGHTHAVMCILLAGNSKYIITGSRDGTVKVWDATLAELLASFDLQSQIKYMAITNSATEDSTVLAATTKSGPIAIMKLKFPHFTPQY